MEAVRCRQLHFSDNSRLVYSPHTYGPSVYDQAYFEVSNFPSNMPAIWDDHFGFVAGLTGKPCITGEWGGPQTGSTNVWLNAFVSYLISKDLRDNIFWALNPNSGSDTPGVLYSWINPDENLLSLLSELQPSPTRFTMGSGNTVCFNAGSGSIVSSSSSSTTSSSASSSSSSSVSTSSSSSSSSSSVATTASSSTSTTSTSTSGGSQGCSVGVSQSLANSWSSDGVPNSQWNVVFTNNGAQNAQITFSLTGGTPSQIWSVVLISGQTYGLPSWDSNGLAPGATLQWGYVVSSANHLTINILTPSCSSGGSAVVSSSSSSGPSSSSSTSSSSSSSGSSGSCHFAIQQSVFNSWDTAGVPYTQFSANIVNTGSQALTSIVINPGSSASSITSTWSLTAESNNNYGFPGWITSLASGATTNFGYIIQGSSQANWQTVSTVC